MSNMLRLFILASHVHYYPQWYSNGLRARLDQKNITLHALTLTPNTLFLNAFTFLHVSVPRPSPCMKMRSATRRLSWPPLRWSLARLSVRGASAKRTTSPCVPSVPWLPPNCWRNPTNAVQSAFVPTFSGQDATLTRMEKRLVYVFNSLKEQCNLKLVVPLWLGIRLALSCNWIAGYASLSE